MATTFREQRRKLRSATRRRVRGGDGRAPVPVQRLARQVSERADTARGRVAASRKPWVVAVLVVLALGGLMISAPLQHYLDGRERVDLLERKAAALQEQTGMLEGRAAALEDPDRVEVLAREQGYHDPGEVPFTVVVPEAERELALEPRDVAPEPAGVAWYRRLWDAVTAVLPF